MMRTAEQAMLDDAHEGAFRTPIKSRAVQEADGSWRAKSWMRSIEFVSSDEEEELDHVPVSQKPRMSLATAIAASNALRENASAAAAAVTDAAMTELEQDLTAAADNRSSWNLLKAKELCQELDKITADYMDSTDTGDKPAAAAATPFVAEELFLRKPLAGTTRSGTKRH
jgi:hypothetical protein